jgi:hypothetical protein
LRCIPYPNPVGITTVLLFPIASTTAPIKHDFHSLQLGQSSPSA